MTTLLLCHTINPDGLYVSLGEEHDGLDRIAKRIYDASEFLVPDSRHSCNLL